MKTLIEVARVEPATPPALEYGHALRGFPEWFNANFTEIQKAFDAIEPTPLLDETTGTPMLDKKGKPVLVTKEDMFDDIEGFAIEMFGED